MSRIREKFKNVDFGPKNVPFIQFWEKYKFSTNKWTESL